MKFIMTVCAFIFSMQVFAAPLNKIVVFGDSLSDNGNLYEYMKHELPLSPPYYQGRFSNGPVWVELVAQNYYPKDAKAHLLDYAFGGAGVSEETDDDEEDVLFTLRREVDSYLLSHNNEADASSLYVIFMGANNYLGVIDNADEVVSNVVVGIQHDLQRLADRGAKHIMVVNVPDLGRTPIARDFDAVDSMTLLSQKHNALLSQTLQQLQVQHADVQWFYFNVNEILDEMLTFPERFGLTNITDTCYEELADHPSDVSVLKMVASVKPKVHVDACSGYLFFDPVHPAEPAHLLMAERTINMLNAAGLQFE